MSVLCYSLNCSWLFLFFCIILQDFQQRHELLEQQVASLRAGSTSSPMDQQTQTDVQSVLDAVEQDTAGVLATVDGLYTGVMKVSPWLSTPPQTTSIS